MSSDEDDGDRYIVHGQLLDPIQEDEIVKRKDAEQQFVKDENGRRRFHGAFTGGFSAGFYNTVGSLEGWTPSTFKSSRDSKSTFKVQNAYDFMDEEDKKDMGIDSSSLKIKSEYSDHSSRKRQLPEVNTGPIPGKPVLGEILKPIKCTWGVELLKSMGWKPGQGVGPQLTQQQKLQSKKELENVGMKFNTNTKFDNDDDEVNELLKNIKVSPYEYESVIIKPKVDNFGLGYEGLKTTNLSVKSTNKYSKLTVGGKSIHGQAFGVGAYEDDDDDIYAADDMTNYDFSLEDKSKKLKNKLKSQNVDSDCIEGFIEDGYKRGLFDELQPPPQIPPEWRPKGMLERIMGQSTPDFYSQSNFVNISNVNVNTRQREIKKTEPLPLVEQFIKKEEKQEVTSLLPNIISDRFTRAVLPDDSIDAFKPVIPARNFDPEIVKLKNFADKKMYGFWTRKTQIWLPEELLCKRFNVPWNKQSKVKYTDDGKKHGECSLFSSLEFASNSPLSTYESQIPNNTSLSTDIIPLATKATNPITLDLNKQFCLKNDVKEEVKEDVMETVQTEESQKPSVDFFKDIFLDESDDESVTVQNSLNNREISTNSSDKNDTHSTEISSVIKKITESNVSKITPANIFPPEGIFANLNFDNLYDTVNKNNGNENENKVSCESENQIDKSYGPFLPERKNLWMSSVSTKIIENTFAEDEWVEKASNNESSHKSKHNKLKKHKNKHKSKKKSHKHK